MGWKTVQEAAEEGPLSRATLERRIAAGAIPSYVDAAGRRLVWLDVSAEVAHRLERDTWLEALEATRAEFKSDMSKLREDLVHAIAAIRNVREPAARDPHDEGRLPQAEGRRTASSTAEILARVEATGISRREIERRAGVPFCFLTKARRGLRDGPKSAKSWRKLEAFLAKAEAEGLAIRH